MLTNLLIIRLRSKSIISEDFFLNVRENDRNYPLRRQSAISDFKPKVKTIASRQVLKLINVPILGIEVDESQGRFQVGENQRAAVNRVEELGFSFIAE